MIKELVVRPIRITQHGLFIQLRSGASTSRHQSPTTLRLTKPQCRNASSYAEDWTCLVRPMATWITNDASRFDTKTFLKQLPRTNDKAESKTSHPAKYKSVLFLVTPQLAHLFAQDSNLHADAVNQIFPAKDCLSSPKSIVAVVDAIPALGPRSYEQHEAPETHGYEGVAVCVSDGFDTVGIDGRTKFNYQQAGIAISQSGKRHSQDREHNIKLVVSPANTLFLNGQTMTMYSQQWDQVEDRHVPKPGSAELLQWIHVDAYRARHNKEPRPGVMLASLQPLTEPARIVASMGNVIREIQLPGKDEAVSASYELESLVPAKLKQKQKKIPAGEIRVYALCSPQAVISRDDKSLSSSTPKPTQAQRHAMSHDLRRDIYYAMLFEGARLYRVNGGGAGWGKKAGLISVDPEERTFGVPTSSTSDTIDFDDIDNVFDLSKNDELFKQDELVQFMYSFHDPEGEVKGAYKIDECVESDFYREDYFVPERVQEIRIGGSFQPSTKQTLRGDKQSSDSHVQKFHPHCFGFLSTSRLNIWTKPQESGWTRQAPQVARPQIAPLDDSHLSSLQSTLLDVPNCSISLIAKAGSQLQPDLLAKIPGMPERLELSSLTSHTIRTDTRTNKAVHVSVLARMLGKPHSPDSKVGIAESAQASGWIEKYVSFHDMKVTELPRRMQHPVQNLHIGKAVLLNSSKPIHQGSKRFGYLRRVVLEKVREGLCRLYYISSNKLARRSGVTSLATQNSQETELDLRSPEPDIKRVPSYSSPFRFIPEGDPRVAANMPTTIRDLSRVRHERDKEYPKTDTLPQQEMTDRDVSLMKHELKKAILDSYGSLTNADKYAFKRLMIRKYAGTYGSDGVKDIQPRFSVSGLPYKWMSFSASSKGLVDLTQQREAEHTLISGLVDEIFADELDAGE